MHKIVYFRKETFTAGIDQKAYIYMHPYIKGVKTFPLNVKGCRDESAKM